MVRWEIYKCLLDLAGFGRFFFIYICIFSLNLEIEREKPYNYICGFTLFLLVLDLLTRLSSQRCLLEILHNHLPVPN
ncbi:hypothetical protein F5Y11DRAFT_324781 [Daldinia sp. FL1419]|nr:hypothetical protein F5Y11DRAFT_324781 [Daldinia sp. FL1419]